MQSNKPSKKSSGITKEENKCYETDSSKSPKAQGLNLPDYEQEKI